MPSSISAILVRPPCAVTVTVASPTLNRPDTFPVGVPEADFFTHASFPSVAVSPWVPTIACDSDLRMTPARDALRLLRAAAVP